MIIHDQNCLIYIQKCSQTLLNHGCLVRLEVSPGRPPVSRHTQALPPPSRRAHSTPPACPGEPCGSEVRDLWSDPKDLNLHLLDFLNLSTQKPTSMSSSRSSSQALIYNQYVRRKHVTTLLMYSSWMDSSTNSRPAAYSFLPCWSKQSSCPATSTQTHTQ